MAEITPTIKYYAYLGGEWVELDVAKDTITVTQGIMTNDPTVRIADVGEMNFTLLNGNDIYTPGHPSALAGWKNGVKIKQVITYGGNDYPSLWHVEPRAGIQIDVNPYGTRRAKVTALDWFDYAMKQPIDIQDSETDVTADDVITGLLAGMSIPPENTSLDVGVETFTSALDTSNQDASVYSELTKLALSEWGYIYLRPDTTDGETLHFENRSRRNGLAAETIYNTDKTFSGESISFEAEVINGENALNSVKVYAYPRKLDTSTVTLYTLSEPIQIPSGKSFTLRGSYTNPSGGARCNGFDMVTPVATTDYLANTARDGSGTNKTADMTVTENYGTNGFEHIITNGSAVTVWITKFTCRGKGIYVENSIDYIAEDTDSIAEIGAVRKTIYQKYQKNLSLPELVAESVLYFDKDPETRIESITFFANRSEACMQAFLNLGIGDVVRLQSTKGGIDALHFIQGIKYKIISGKVIEMTWIVKQFLTLAVGLSLVGCGFGMTSAADMVDYGAPPQVGALEEMSVSAWVYMTQHPPTNSAVIISKFGLEAGWVIYAGQSTQGAIFLRQDDGIWRTPASALGLNGWHHIVVTRDTTPYSNAPVIYIDGVSQTITELNAQSAATVDDSAYRLTVGNYKVTGYDAVTPFYGYIVGPRIYNTILDQSAVTAIYNAGKWDTDTETDNLVWQGDCFKSEDVDHWDGANVMDANNKLIDNIYNAIGSRSGSPLPFVDVSSPEYIKSLLHFDGSDSGTAFIDDTGKTWTASGNAVTDTDEKKFGTAAGLFDGSSNTFITTPDHDDFHLSDANWTFDFWINFSDISQPAQAAIVSQYVDANNFFRILRVTSSNRLQCIQYESGADIWNFYCNFTPTVGVWYHIAVVRDDDTPYIFINGVSQTVTETTAISGTTASNLAAVMALGGDSVNANRMYASIDEFRFSNGVARWTANFTPPAAEYIGGVMQDITLANSAYVANGNNFEVPDGINRILVFLGTDNYGLSSVRCSSVTYNSLAFTRLDHLSFANGAYTEYWFAHIWYLVNPPVGTYSVGVNAGKGMLLALTGVHQGAPFIDSGASGRGTGSATTPSITADMLNTMAVAVSVYSTGTTSNEYHTCTDGTVTEMKEEDADEILVSRIEGINNGIITVTGYSSSNYIATLAATLRRAR